MRLVAIGVTVVAACGGSQRNSPPAGVLAADLGDRASVLTRLAELAERDHTVVDVEGAYVLVDIGPYKMAYTLPDGSVRTTKTIVQLRLADDSALTLGARPEAEHAFLGKRVRVTGRVEMQWPPRQDPEVAQPDPTPWLVDITAVRAI